MDIQSAQFISSSADTRSFPSDNLFEYAFVGRSNVGKSSLINALCHRKKLAKTSSTPGKTLLINHFLINNSWYLVDLPGYGYARISKDERKILSHRIKQYLSRRKQLIQTFVLVDCQVKPQSIDLEFFKWMHSKGLPFIIVFTKVDSLKPQKLNFQIKTYQNILAKKWNPIPETMVSSSVSKIGIKNILEVIATLNYHLKNSD